MSDKHPVIVDEFHEWRAGHPASPLSPPAMNTLRASQRLHRYLREQFTPALAALHALGLSSSELSALQPDDQIGLIITLLKSRQDPVERAAMAAAIFGASDWDDALRLATHSGETVRTPGSPLW